MADGEAVDGGRPRCQARPVAARRGFREDVLCASYANTLVVFRGSNVPVCRIHEATYVRWADEADDNATIQWAWGSAEGIPQLAKAPSSGLLAPA
jgi:hypothetical protein